MSPPKVLGLLLRVELKVTRQGVVDVLLSVLQLWVLRGAVTSLRRGRRLGRRARDDPGYPTPGISVLTRLQIPVRGTA